MLTASVTVHDLTINDTKFISISNNTLTVNGAEKGNGGITGSILSNLVITGNAGTLRFVHGDTGEAVLHSLTVQQGAKAVIGNNVKAEQVTISPSAQVTVPAGINLITN